MRAWALVALGLTTAAVAYAPAVAAAATGGATMPTVTAKKQSKASERADPSTAAVGPDTQDTQDAAAGGAAFGAIPELLRPTVPGKVAVLRDGVAYAPADAPLAVKRAIWAANKIQRKPYIYGGGHKSFRARGYDCSGTVSFALNGGGLLKRPLDSTAFMRWGKRGRGRWITVYTNPSHAFVVIAGLRLDTSGPGESGPRWRETPRSTRGFVARHPASL